MQLKNLKKVLPKSLNKPPLKNVKNKSTVEKTASTVPLKGRRQVEAILRCVSEIVQLTMAVRFMATTGAEAALAQVGVVVHSDT